MKIKSLLNKFSSKGFTMIELLIVIAILGILATGILVAINPVKRINQAKDSTMKTNMAQIVNALQTSFTANNGIYPATLAVLASSGELKTVPNQPDNNAFNYAVSSTCTTTSCSAVVWGSYSDTSVGIFHCWDSGTNAYHISATAPTGTTCPQ